MLAVWVRKMRGVAAIVPRSKVYGDMSGRLMRHAGSAKADWVF